MAWTTGQATVDEVLNTWLNKVFIEDLVFDLQYQKFCASAIIPAGGGSCARFIDWSPPFRNVGYSAGNTQLAEGTTAGHEIVTGITLFRTEVTVTEFGEFTKITSLYELAAMAGTRQGIVKRLGKGAAVALDEAVRAEALRTTVAYTTNTAQSGANFTGGTTVAGFDSVNAAPPLGAAGLMTIRAILKGNLVPGITGVEGHPDRQYAAVLSPAQEAQITTEVTTGRVYWSNAVVNVPGAEGQLKFVNGYIGSVYSTCVYITQNFSLATFTTAGNTSIGFMLGADAIAAVAFRQMQPEIIINDVNSPYKNLNSIAWHAYFGAGLVLTQGSNQNRIIKIYSSA